MLQESYSYQVRGNAQVRRCTQELLLATALDGLLSQLDQYRGGLLKSSYEFPGRYKRWAIGFVNPPLEISSRGNTFAIIALNERGQVLVSYLALHLCRKPELRYLTRSQRWIKGTIQFEERPFQEEERSRQPSIFTLIRYVLDAFHSEEDCYLGLYGAVGYDIIFQFESLTQQCDRKENQRDLILYLPDDFWLVDYYAQRAFKVQYEFATEFGSTHGLPRDGEVIDFRGQQLMPTRQSDHEPGEYADLVRHALDYFRRGDLFEVVPSQSFFRHCQTAPSQLFQTLHQINPSPYSFVFNLGGEYLVGSSPEMFVRVEGRRVETCPISGTIRRGQNAIEDAYQVLKLLNSHKDEAELTMCTDVDRNDKSRVCEPGSVQVIGRRQIELYSHLIHTVDHVEGTLRPEFDAIDAFLTHTWAVTVTGAPKRAAIQFIEQHERSARRWYGGAVGGFTFNGHINTGLILRTICLKDTIAEVRVGATLLYDSIPETEEEETLTKAAAMMQTLQLAQSEESRSPFPQTPPTAASFETGQRVLLIDYEDSFVHTLANYICQTGAHVVTLRHGFPDSVWEMEQPDLVVLSPGPGTPRDFHISRTIRTCLKREIPLFGVCLGLQGIVETFGGELSSLPYPQHGKPSRISVVAADSRLFQKLPQTFVAGRYHSLCAMPEQVPPELNITAISEDGVVMAVEHKTLPIAAVQFHPESIMTLAESVGLSIIYNVMRTYAKSATTSNLVPLC
ncbi:Anthranilate synthase component 1 [Halomicronema hongdechloris C2206]|uniref:Anthranilate synthase n=1 Tax=Halomicronema hongdechloris C2206 TaxID=1641165 RepID=A0A1Z3HMS4_9CYAN|nr:anthranilate synthase [Halomicronema hongdechloris]ASC71613.1 Anthranilate synthase component 1 [Halomicronema hongdechloris C2206]